MLDMVVISHLPSLGLSFLVYSVRRVNLKTIFSGFLPSHLAGLC